jgi:hypothetical protein
MRKLKPYKDWLHELLHKILLNRKKTAPKKLYRHLGHKRLYLIAANMAESTRKAHPDNYSRSEIQDILAITIKHFEATRGNR